MARSRLSSRVPHTCESAFNCLSHSSSDFRPGRPLREGSRAFVVAPLPTGENFPPRLSGAPAGHLGCFFGSHARLSNPLHARSRTSLRRSSGVAGPLESGSRSGMPRSTVAICARAIFPSLRAREIAPKPPIFAAMSMGRPISVPICSESSAQSRGSQSPSAPDRFRSGMLPRNAPPASHEMPRPLPVGARLNSRFNAVPFSRLTD